MQFLALLMHHHGCVSRPQCSMQCVPRVVVRVPATMDQLHIPCMHVSMIVSLDLSMCECDKSGSGQMHSTRTPDDVTRHQYEFHRPNGLLSVLSNSVIPSL